MPINSKRKGKVGELEWVQFLKDEGIEARRGQQFKGGEGSPDVISSVERVHWEVKRKESLSIYNAMEQAITDASDGSYPVVAHRKNDKPWLVILCAEDFIEIIKKAGMVPSLPSSPVL